MNIRPTKKTKILVIQPDTESENETVLGEKAPLRLRKSGLKAIFHKNWKTLQEGQVLTIECSNHKAVSEITDLIWGQSKERSLGTGIGFPKISQSIMS